MQGFALSIQQTGGRLHLHQNTDPRFSLVVTAPAPTAATALFVHAYRTPAQQTRNADPQHDHQGLARHEHPATDASVVVVEEDERLSLPNPAGAPMRGVHELDGLLPRWAALEQADRPGHWRTAAAQLIRSHITPVLDRPPQA